MPQLRSLLMQTILILAVGWVIGLEAAERPNVVVVLVDDLGWADLGCYGAEHYHSPNIDRLASDGLRFSDAYAACAVCSPTRAALLTGRYPARLHLTDFIAGHIHPYAQLQVPRWRAHLPLAELTLAEAFKEAGYATGFIGKWHLGDDRALWPEQQGFDLNLGGTGGGAPWRGYFSPYGIRTLPDGPEGEYLTDRLGDEAAAFIARQARQPFLLYLSFFSVHTPIMGKPELVERYARNPALSAKDHAAYAAMIASMDQNVGKVLAALETHGLSDDTIVVFTSDNGGIFPNGPLHAGKGTPYEGGIRVPLIIRAPGRTRPGSSSATPSTSTDLYPTLLELAGLPLRPEQHADGLSLVPTFAEGGSLPREALFWHYPHYHNARPYGIVRRGDWKLIEHYEDSRVELYDLAEDIGERRDLAAQQPERSKQLRALLDAWRMEVGAQMPQPNPAHDPARADEKLRGSERKRWIEANLDNG